MEPDWLPEPQVVELAREKQLRGRLAIWFDWGEYAMWYFGPSLPVSIDGRRETIFSQQVVDRHLQFYYRPSTREAFLSDFRPDYIWLPHDLPVVTTSPRGRMGSAVLRTAVSVSDAPWRGRGLGPHARRRPLLSGP
jgi:hypothetical protein